MLRSMRCCGKPFCIIDGNATSQLIRLLQEVRMHITCSLAMILLLSCTQELHTVIIKLDLLITFCKMQNSIQYNLIIVTIIED